MLRHFKPEKGSLDINGHKYQYEMLRSKEPSDFGIRRSRIFELNLYRDGTLVADFDKKWLIKPSEDNADDQAAMNELIDKFGAAKAKKEKPQ